MLSGILDERHRELLQRERRLLQEISATLVRCETGDDDRRTLAASIEQLDALFLLVIVGEFNAGKSAFLNALLGQQILAEGVTPTTAEIHLISHGDEVSVSTVAAGLHRVTAPVELLRHVTLVDTPGTNALERRHEAITAEFVPRADLVLFLTSADRPLSESERAFLEGIRAWGKKVLLVLNKVDLLRSASAVQEVRQYILEHCRLLLGFEPLLFEVSSTAAQAARSSGSEAAQVASGMAAIEEHLRTTLDDAERLRLKLLNPLGVAETLLERSLQVVGERLELLKDDVRALDDIDRQLTVYGEDVEHELQLRLADIDNNLHVLERRGHEFFDDTLRLTRVKDLLNRDLLRSQFEHVVVANEPQLIEAKVESLIDWLVESDLSRWQAVVQHVSRRQSHHAERIVGDVATRFEVDRSGLLGTVGRAAREGLARYDRAAEARRLADEVQRAVAGTALVEVGAVGLGATVGLLATSSAADATGLVAAGLLATLGLFILPNRRQRAKQQLKEKISEMRRHLAETITEHFRREAAASQARIRETIAPYTRFVRSERDTLQERQQALHDLRDQVATLRGSIERTSSDPCCSRGGQTDS